MWILNMRMEIIRIYGGIVTCQLEDGHIIDIAQQWFDSDIQVGDEMDFNLFK